MRCRKAFWPFFFCLFSSHSINIDECLFIFLIHFGWPLLPVVRLFQDNGMAFTDSDASIIDAFAIFCGLGIHNTQMYENACKLMAKQKVALECLSYHATASPDQTKQLSHDTIQSAEDYALYSFKFIGKCLC